MRLPARSLRLVHPWLVALSTVVFTAELGSALLLNLGWVSYSRTSRQAPALAGSYTAAAAFARGAISINNRNSRAHVLAGLVAAGQRDADAAMAQFRRAVELDGHDIFANNRLAEAYHARGERELAVRHWRAAHAAADLVRQGEHAYSVRGDLSNAFEYFKIATEVNPEEYGAWIGLGQVHAKSNRLEEARSCYEEAIRRDPSAAPGYVRLADLYSSRLGQPVLADSVIEKGLLNVRPPGRDLSYLASRSAAAHLRYSAAEQHIRNAIALDPTNGAYIVWLGDLCLWQGRSHEALAEYERAGRTASEPKWLWIGQMRIGQVYADRKEWSAAIAALEAAVITSAAQREAGAIVAKNYIALGDVLTSAGQRESARAAYGQALNRDPGNKTAATRLAATHLGQPAVVR